MVVEAEVHGGGATSEAAPVHEGATGEGQADVPTKTGKETSEGQADVSTETGKQTDEWASEGQASVSTKTSDVPSETKAKKGQQDKKVCALGGRGVSLIHLTWDGLKHFEHFTQS